MGFDLCSPVVALVGRPAVVWISRRTERKESVHDLCRHMCGGGCLVTPQTAVRSRLGGGAQAGALVLIRLRHRANSACDSGDWSSCPGNGHIVAIEDCRVDARCDCLQPPAPRRRHPTALRDRATTETSSSCGPALAVCARELDRARPCEVPLGFVAVDRQGKNVGKQKK